MSIDEKVALYFGALLHDVGKIVYREGSTAGTSTQLGRDFMAELAECNSVFRGEAGRLIVEQIRYPHAQEVREADISDDSLAFLTSHADRISIGGNRQHTNVDSDAADSGTSNRNADLRKIFNIVRGHDDDNVIPHEDYRQILSGLKDGLINIDVSSGELNSLLNLLEETTSTIPSSTNMSDLIDVSLFDHAKVTAGIAACLYDWCAEQGIKNYREAFFDPEMPDRHWEDKTFLLFTCGMSGIQDFIYGISGSKALKQLRARSFYLELMMEHIVDELLLRLDLCRANLLYSGGGHAYLLLPNTENARSRIQKFIGEVSAWCLEYHTTDLYLASADIPCSAADLANDDADKRRYPKLYRMLESKISDVKASRYDAETICKLNFGGTVFADHSRECTECRRSDIKIGADDRCSLCSSLGEVSKKLVQKDVVFAVLPEKGTAKPARCSYLELPGHFVVTVMTRDDYRSQQPAAHRLYVKNASDLDFRHATHIWMGDYIFDTDDQENRFETYASNGATLNRNEDGERIGIKRLGVLRADVDDLGAVFASGIPAEKASISRTVALSRALSYFFKRKINEILAKKDYRLQIIYSGGDDLFIVGNWSDVIQAGIDIRSEFDTFTGNGSVTLSAGIGMFTEKYPIARMASETGELEDAAKAYRSHGAAEMPKNAITLWTNDAVFSWQEFEELVRRKDDISRMFSASKKGNAFIYKVIALLRNYDEAASAPRLAYLLARSFEDMGTAGEKAMRDLYGWASNEQKRKILINALEWYVCSIRERS